MAMRIKPFLMFSVSVKLPCRASNASLAPPTRRTTALPWPLRVTKYSMLCLLQEQNPLHKHKHTQSYSHAQRYNGSTKPKNPNSDFRHFNIHKILTVMFLINPSKPVRSIDQFQYVDTSIQNQRSYNKTIKMYQPGQKGTVSAVTSALVASLSTYNLKKFSNFSAMYFY